MSSFIVSPFIFFIIYFIFYFFCLGQLMQSSPLPCFVLIPVTSLDPTLLCLPSLFSSSFPLSSCPHACFSTFQLVWFMCTSTVLLLLLSSLWPFTVSCCAAGLKKNGESATYSFCISKYPLTRNKNPASVSHQAKTKQKQCHCGGPCSSKSTGGATEINTQQKPIS